MQELVSTEVATSEVNKWLDAKRIPQSKRESKDFLPFINNIIDGVKDGALTLKEDFTWSHKLIVPLEKAENGEIFKTELTYKFRINEAMKNANRRSVRAEDSSFLLTLITLTGESRGAIEMLDSSTDKVVADAIAVFFL